MEFLVSMQPLLHSIRRRYFVAFSISVRRRMIKNITILPKNRRNNSFWERQVIFQIRVIYDKKLTRASAF